MPAKKKNPTKPLNRKEADLFSAIAHFEFVTSASRDLPHMKDFLPYYLKSIPLAQRQTMVRYGVAKEQARQSICEEFEKHGWREPIEMLVCSVCRKTVNEAREAEQPRRKCCTQTMLFKGHVQPCACPSCPTS